MKATEASQGGAILGGMTRRSKPAENGDWNRFDLNDPSKLAWSWFDGKVDQSKRARHFSPTSPGRAETRPLPQASTAYK